MRKIFNKVCRIAGGTLLAGLTTVGFVAAAAFPAPFVENGKADVAIVYGSNPAALDQAAAGNINEYLKPLITSSGGTTVEGGESFKLEKSTNKFNLGDNLNSIYTSLDDNELPFVLADGTYENDENSEYDYTQTLRLGTASLTHFSNSDYKDEQPTIGFELTNDNHILNYTLDFTNNADGGTAWADFDDTEIEILGKNYYISNAEGTSNGLKLTLLDTANEATVADGETKTIELEGTSYTVELEWADADEVVFVVNGQTTPKLNEGDTYKVSGDLYIGARDILYNEKESGVSKATFTLGTGKIELEHGQEIKLNGDEITTWLDDRDLPEQKLTAYFTNTTDEWADLTLSWDLVDDFFLASGEEIEMPGLKAIKISMGEFETPDTEEIQFDAGTRYFQLKAPIEDGTVTLPLFFVDDAETYIKGLGKGGGNNEDQEPLITNATGDVARLNLTQKSIFVATWASGTSGTGNDFESYVYQIEDIDEQTSGEIEVKLKNLVTGGENIIFSDVDDTEDVGSITFTLASANETTKIAEVSFAAASSGVTYADRIVTKNGLMMNLPVNTTGFNVTANTGLTTGSPANWNMTLTEQDNDGNVASGEPFTITIAADAGDGIHASSTNITTYETDDDSDEYVGYQVSDLATKVMIDKSSDLNELTLMYSGDESFANVIVAEMSVTVSSGGSVGNMLYKDTETSAYSNKNVIVVGGSCINTAAAALVGGSFCGEAWTATTGVGAGEFLIKGYADSSVTSKMALLVAGYEAADTTNAVTYLTQKASQVDTSNAYKGTSANEATVIVE